MEEELNRRAEEEGGGALWQRGARKSIVTRVGVVYSGDGSDL